ncbi:hypothetical protein [Streptomyces osmaniensis]|uniref:Uncharacterized protein n=1 Tax=Streptomyces osmaniensis TaxID=593134 RepID=A0ABP6YTH5_9ACTN|nr:hypothetical protein KJK32_46630 [Streptomyces sp. JCM17656]
MTEQPTAVSSVPWCCDGTPGYVSECPLCPQYGTSLLDLCPGHEGSGENKTRIVEARLHAKFRHPGYEYATTKGPRKQWDDADQPPTDDNGDTDPAWESNIDAGRAGQGWDRFDYHEEAYWRRPKKTPPADVTEGPDPRQAAYDAVFAYIRQQPCDFLPTTVVDRNAMIWHAVHAALDAVGIPRADSTNEEG